MAIIGKDIEQAIEVLESIEVKDYEGFYIINTIKNFIFLIKKIQNFFFLWHNCFKIIKIKNDNDKSCTINMEMVKPLTILLRSLYILVYLSEIAKRINS